MHKCDVFALDHDKVRVITGDIFRCQLVFRVVISEFGTYDAYKGAESTCHLPSLQLLPEKYPDWGKSIFTNCQADQAGQGRAAEFKYF